jgi:hypothetical protein
MTFWTYTLSSGSIVLNGTEGASFISIQTDPANGSCTVLGGIPFQGLQPVAVPLSIGQGINFSANTPASPLAGITITWVAGTIDIIVGF